MYAKNKNEKKNCARKPETNQFCTNFIFHPVFCFIFFTELNFTEKKIIMDCLKHW